MNAVRADGDPALDAEVIAGEIPREDGDMALPVPLVPVRLVSREAA
jgi:hypothetical protein